jgi:hypothetical protein
MLSLLTCDELRRELERAEFQLRAAASLAAQRPAGAPAPGRPEVERLGAQILMLREEIDRRCGG